MSEFVTTQHFQPCYYINASVPTLWDGAQQTYRLGSRVFKFSLSSNMLDDNRWNNDRMPWPDASNLTSLTQVAQHPQVAGLFSNAPELGTDFKTFIMWAYRAGQAEGCWCDQFDPEDAEAEATQFADLTQYLMEAYQGTGRTFVVEHWEGDWALRCGALDPATGKSWGPSWSPPKANSDNMTRWLQARQTGVDLGRAAYCRGASSSPGSPGLTTAATAAGSARLEGVDCSDGRAVMDAAGVFVYHGAVVNHVKSTLLNPAITSMITAVVPRVALDTLGYSSYETQGTPLFSQVLDFMYSQMNRTKASPPRPIGIAEWGSSLGPTSNPAQLSALATGVVSTCLKKPFVGKVVHWQAINNETPGGGRCLRGPGSTHAVPQFEIGAQSGFMTVKPDGQLSWYGHFIQGVINGTIQFP